MAKDVITSAGHFRITAGDANISIDGVEENTYTAANGRARTRYIAAAILDTQITADAQALTVEAIQTKMFSRIVAGARFDLLGAAASEPQRSSPSVATYWVESLSAQRWLHPRFGGS